MKLRIRSRCSNAWRKINRNPNSRNSSKKDGGATDSTRIIVNRENATG